MQAICCSLRGVHPIGTLEEGGWHSGSKPLMENFLGQSVIHKYLFTCYVKTHANSTASYYGYSLHTPILTTVWLNGMSVYLEDTVLVLTDVYYPRVLCNCYSSRVVYATNTERIQLISFPREYLDTISVFVAN